MSEFIELERNEDRAQLSQFALGKEVSHSFPPKSVGNGYHIHFPPDIYGNAYRLIGNDIIWHADNGYANWLQMLSYREKKAQMFTLRLCWAQVKRKRNKSLDKTQTNPWELQTSFLCNTLTVALLVCIYLFVLRLCLAYFDESWNGSKLDQLRSI